MSLIREGGIGTLERRVRLINHLVKISFKPLFQDWNQRPLGYKPKMN